jgi:hypothetical protein
MKHFALHLVPCILLWTTVSFASKRPTPVDYTVNVHVSSSRTTWLCSERGVTPDCRPILVLNATIDGVKSELQGGIEPNSKAAKFDTDDGFLALGDYKAMLVPSKLKRADVPYFVMKIYELLMPDGRLANFQVAGQSE